MTLAFVIWDGVIGGAELFTLSLVAEIRSRGVDASVIFVGHPDQLRRSLRRTGTPFDSVGLRPGSRVVLHPRLLAAAVTRTGATAAIIDSVGYLGAALRLGGYSGHIVGVEHGALIATNQRPLRRRAARLPGRVVGLRAYDAEVTVSGYMERVVRRHPHHPRLMRVPNGVSLPPSPAPPFPPPGPGEIRLGFVGRLVAGKGIDVLLRAVALLNQRSSDQARPVVSIAGDGRARPALEKLARRLGLATDVKFLGWIDDISRVWAECGVAVAPNDYFKESFCMAVAEAMAFGRPVIASALGALPELVVNGRTGLIVRPGNVEDLAAAIDHYRATPERQVVHGAAARRFAVENLSIQRCADQYLGLIAALPPRPRAIFTDREHQG
ncbi:MAG: glycosyltransferase family 4 protein [Solirubrobacteraceae bacterium]